MKHGTKTTDGRKHRPFGILDSVSYAAGDFGCNMSFALKGTLAIFWTQYMGLDLWYSALLVVVQIWDAINDPLIGSLIDADHRKHRHNKFLDYIQIGAIGLVAAGALCFIPLPHAPLFAKIIIFVVGYVIWDAFYTVANVPYGSLLSLISSDSADRASLSAWRSVGSAVGSMIPMVVLPFLIYDKNDNLIGGNVFIAALVMGLVGFFAFRFMIRNTVVREEREVLLEHHEKFNIFSAIGNFFQNRPAVGATVAAMGMFLGMHGTATAITVLFQSYFHNVQISGVIQLFSMIPVLAFTPLARKAVARYGKKELSVFGSLLCVAAAIAMLLLPIPPNTRGIAVYVACQLVYSLGLGIYNTVSWALMGDAIDYHEWKHGRREEGMVYSIHSFFRKLSQGVGPALVLVVMVWLGYVGANQGQQTAEVARNMRYLVAALYLISALLELVGLAFVYNLDKKTLVKMHEELKESRMRKSESFSEERKEHS
ncbi:MAG: MFS transporter [Ruminococcaceae bacterium]|nr:MFS transporter [Oscillospiraceae bacterium]